MRGLNLRVGPTGNWELRLDPGGTCRELLPALPDPPWGLCWGLPQLRRNLWGQVRPEEAPAWL